MSAQPVWEQPSELPKVAPARHLRLVGEAEVRTAHSSVSTRSRLTRRGRLSITVALTIAALALASTMVLSGGAANATSQEIVVQADQTLSQIAAAELPNTRLDMAIVDIQLANNMSSDQVAAGQTLVIPAEQGFRNN